VPEIRPDDDLDRLLATREAVPGDSFVLAVMQRVRRERRIRRVVLAACGGVGAVFGLGGAALLSEPIAQLFAGLAPNGAMQVVLLSCAAIAFYGWIMNEDISLYA
jgi:hypothetical protein